MKKKHTKLIFLCFCILFNVLLRDGADADTLHCRYYGWNYYFLDCTAKGCPWNSCNFGTASTQCHCATKRCCGCIGFFDGFWKWRRDEGRGWCTWDCEDIVSDPGNCFCKDDGKAYRNQTIQEPIACAINPGVGDSCDCDYGPARVETIEDPTCPPCFIDIGLRVYDGNNVVAIACWPQGILNSPLRIAKNGIIYSIVLVDPLDPKATKVTIKTSSEIKALRKYP